VVSGGKDRSTANSVLPFNRAAVLFEIIQNGPVRGEELSTQEIAK
jgi:hypothetical protein